MTRQPSERRYVQPYLDLTAHKEITLSLPTAHEGSIFNLSTEHFICHRFPCAFLDANYSSRFLLNELIKPKIEVSKLLFEVVCACTGADY